MPAFRFDNTANTQWRKFEPMTGVDYSSFDTPTGVDLMAVTAVLEESRRSDIRRRTASSPESAISSAIPYRVNAQGCRQSGLGTL